MLQHTKCITNINIALEGTPDKTNHTDWNATVKIKRTAVMQT